MLIRLISYSLEEAGEQLGTLWFENGHTMSTLELPWKDNQRNISCIPSGIYECAIVKDVKLYNGQLIPITFQILSVPNRSGILFHAGNTAKDTRGCILVGSYHDVINNKRAVCGSKKAFDIFIKTLKDYESFDLKVDRATYGK